MAWIFLAVSEDFNWLSPNMLDQSRIAKLNRIVRRCSCLGCSVEKSQRHQYGMTLVRCEEANWKASTLSMVDFHARTSALREMEKAWQESEAGFFERSC